MCKALSLGQNQLSRDVTTAEFKMHGIIPHLPHTPSWPDA